MELEFEFEIADWMELQKNYLKNSKHFKRTKNIVLFMLPVVFSFLIFSDVLRNKFSFISIVIYGFASLLWILFYSKYLEKRALAKTRKMIEEGDNTGIIGKHKIILQEDGITHIEPESEKRIKWSGIKRLEENNDYYFLYNTTVSAIIIPKRKVAVDLDKLNRILIKNIANT